MRQQFLTIAGGFAALTLHAAILMGGAALIRDRESAAAPDFVLETPDLAAVEEPSATQDVPLEPSPPAADQEAAAKAARLPVRSIEPGSFALPENSLAPPLERLAPVPSPSAPQAKQKPSTATLQRPVALAAGLVQAGDVTLQLKGIEPESVERACGRGSGRWPCGMIARTAFRKFLRGRALVCDEMEERANGTVIGNCTLAGVDAAEWLVANGWAMPQPGTALEAKAQAARSGKRGFYGGDPRDLRGAPIVVDDPSATLLDETTPGLQAGDEIPD